MEGSESCDDGNDLDDDGCSNTCELALAVAAGARHTCALWANGQVRCWGENTATQLGHGGCEVYFEHCGYPEYCEGPLCCVGDDEPLSSIDLVDVGGAATKIAAGGVFTCALVDGGVRCWGHGLAAGGSVCNGHNLCECNEDPSCCVGDDERPGSADLIDLGGIVIEIAAGYGHACGLLTDGTVRCWGSSGEGRLGYGNSSDCPSGANYCAAGTTCCVGDDESPASVEPVDVGGTAVQIAAGASHTCALLDDGSVRCWGYGLLGCLGNGNEEVIGDDEVPGAIAPVDVGGIVVQIDAGNYHSCALLDSGAVRCWGSGGSLGYGNTDNIGDDEMPSAAGPVEVGGRVTQIAAGGSHTCALLETHEVRCWGRNDSGQLGYGNTEAIGDDEVPSSAGLVAVGGKVVQLAAGGEHTCAVLDTGALRCWGLGRTGQLGYGNTDNIGDDELPSFAGDVPVF